MPRFNAAKSWKKLDDDLSGKFNYLCDLLDEGYSSVALINNHEIAIDINPKDGIKIVNDGSSIFSLDPLTGEIVIGKYDGLISDLETDLGTAYNDIAQQLGYTDYDDMVAEAIAGNTIINGGWLRTSLIQANTILFDQLASSTFNTINYLSGNLIQNTTLENSVDRWTGDVTKSTDTYEGYVVPVLGVVSGGDNRWGYSNYFNVDPSKAYEVSVWVKKSAAIGNIYLGLHMLDTSGASIGIRAIWQTTGVLSNSNETNFYFGYTDTGSSPTDWERIVQYIMPAGTPDASCKGLGEYGSHIANRKVAIMRPDTGSIRLRIGNYANAGTPTTVYVANMKVTQVDAQSVIKMVQTGVRYAGVMIDATNGFVSTATIGGNTIQTKANATDGFSIYKGANKIFGVDTDGNLFSSRLSNAETPTAWSIVGEITQGGTTRRGIFGYNSAYSSSDPGFMMLVPSWGGLTVLVQNEEGIAFSDAYTSPSVVSNHYLLSLGAANGYGSFLLGLYDGAGTYEAGMDLGYNDLAGYWEFKLYAGDDWLTIIDGEFRFNGDSVWHSGNANFAAGSGTVSSSWTSVSFGKTFASPPKVVACYAADFTGDSGILKVRNVTKTGFEWVIGGSFTSRNANWLAILI